MLCEKEWLTVSRNILGALLRYSILFQLYTYVQATKQNNNSMYFIGILCDRSTHMYPPYCTLLSPSKIQNPPSLVKTSGGGILL